jgi:hypothetical protein
VTTVCTLTVETYSDESVSVGPPTFRPNPIVVTFRT